MTPIAFVILKDGKPFTTISSFRRNRDLYFGKTCTDGVVITAWVKIKKGSLDVTIKIDKTEQILFVNTNLTVCGPTIMPVHPEKRNQRLLDMSVDKNNNIKNTYKDGSVVIYADDPNYDVWFRLYV